MISAILSAYRPLFAVTIVYMLQSTEYDVSAYLKWFWDTHNFSKVMYRRKLVRTRAANLLLLTLSLGMAAQIVIAMHLAILAAQNQSLARWLVAIAVFLLTPALWALLIVVPLLFGRWFYIRPKYALAVHRSKSKFNEHEATKIAVAGSYGKTTMKEILLTVLSEGKKVAATPANKNVAISHANFANGLIGDEEVLVIEYGEGAPGDVRKFAATTKPDIGIITGLAPAHLDKYKTLERAGKDIFSLADFLKPGKLFVNDEADGIKNFVKSGYKVFNSSSAAGWKISGVKIDIKGLKFKLTKGSESLSLQSTLLGRHQIGPLALVAVLAKELGLSDQQVKSGITKVASFEHRMEPRQLSGAWLIDDTYNGNIEGMRAGLELLKELPAQRKIYITPGLVDQGAKSPEIHQHLGKLIASAKPDMVVLMKHSVTKDIISGLESENFKGKLLVEEDPLNFYTNLDKLVAAGDLVLMQNDWPDNYN